MRLLRIGTELSLYPWSGFGGWSVSESFWATCLNCLLIRHGDGSPQPVYHHGVAVSFSGGHFSPFNFSWVSSFSLLGPTKRGVQFWRLCTTEWPLRHLLSSSDERCVGVDAVDVPSVESDDRCGCRTCFVGIERRVSRWWRLGGGLCMWFHMFTFYWGFLSPWLLSFYNNST